MTKRILVPIGDATETLDAFYANYRLPEDGHKVVLAGREIRPYRTALHEIPPDSVSKWDVAEEFPGYYLQSNIAFRDLFVSHYDGAFLPGGRAPDYIRCDPDLCRVIHEIAEAGKPIACLGQGIKILTAAQCIQGKRVTTTPECALDAKLGGAQYVDEDAVVDGLLVTGRGHKQNTAVLKAFLQMLANT